MNTLVENYNPVYQEPELFYDNYHRNIVDKYNTAKPQQNLHYTPWPICTHTEAPPQLPNIGNTVTGTNTLSDQPPDSGVGTMHLRTLFSPNNTITNQQCGSFNPPHISTPYPMEKTPYATPENSPENKVPPQSSSTQPSINVTRQLFPQGNTDLARSQRTRKPPDRYMNPIPSSLIKHLPKK